MPSELLYFPKKEFSPRFGDTFFTFDIKGHEIQGRSDVCGGAYCTYTIEIARGKRRWEVKHRFSDFDKLQNMLRGEIDFAQDLPALPPKTCFRTVDEVLFVIILILCYLTNTLLQSFLQTRQEQLFAYMEGVLKVVSDRKVIFTHALSLRNFLELKEL